MQFILTCYSCCTSTASKQVCVSTELTLANRASKRHTITKHALTVDFLPVFTAKHAIIVHLLLTDVYFVLGRESFGERISSFRHFNC